MKYVYVETDSICTHSYRSGEMFGDWEESYDFRVQDTVSLTKPKYGVEEFGVPDDVQFGDVLYVLYMTYSTGDSFGHSSGNGAVIWLFRDEENANNARDLCESQIENYHFSFTNEDGVFMKIGNPAYGYFEHLEFMGIQKVTVTK